MTIVTDKPKEALKLFTFKPTPLTEDKDKMETVVATSLSEAVRKNPEMLTWYLHAIQK